MLCVGGGYVHSCYRAWCNVVLVHNYQCYFNLVAEIIKQEQEQEE